MAFLGSWVHHFNLCLHLPMASSQCASQYPHFLLRKTPVVGLEPTLIHHDLILIHLQRPSFQIGHIHTYWGLGLEPIFWGDMVQPTTRTVSMYTFSSPEPEVLGKLSFLSPNGFSPCDLGTTSGQKATLPQTLPSGGLPPRLTVLSGRPISSRTLS